MGTSSIIGYEENGKYYISYGGCDGYIEHNGEILLETYNTLDKVKELISRENFNALYNDINYIDFDRYNDFEESILDSFDEVLEYRKKYYVDYLYIFKDNKWMIWKDFNTKTGDFVKNPKLVLLEDMYLSYAKEDIEYLVTAKIESLKLIVKNYDKLNTKDKKKVQNLVNKVNEISKIIEVVNEKDNL